MKNIVVLFRFLAITILIVLSTLEVGATGEASTYFQVFVPPNAVNSSRAASLIVTAIHDSTSFQIIDDGMDGDTDDSYSGMLMAGQSYVLYIKDNGVNDDRGGKTDGDYFIITSNELVLVSQSTDSDWQHDWVPAFNKTSKGQRFIVYAPKITSSNRDINVYAYQDSTTVTIKEVHRMLSTSTGYTDVNLDTNLVVAQRTLNVGEDIIFTYSDGRNIMKSGGTYLIEANKDITVQYGALWQNSRDGGGYVPSENGSSSGELFYFTVHTQASNEQEIRIVSWDSTNVVQLDYFDNGSWLNVNTWNLGALEPADWVASSGNIDKVFRVQCSSDKKVSVFEANWLETGSPGTSDIASMMSGHKGHAAGKEFVAYMAPPGTETNVLNPFTGIKDLGQSTHLYLFAKDSATVTVVDAKTEGQVINRTYNIAAGAYADCALNLSEWQSIYNGDGNPNTGSERPYLLVQSDVSIAVFNTNFNDNWMSYFGTSKEVDFTLEGDVVTPGLAIMNDCFDVNDTAVIRNHLVFNNMSADLVDPVVHIIIPDGAVIAYSTLENVITGQTYNGTISINPNNGTSTVNFANLPDFTPLHDYRIETGIMLAINRYDGTLITDRTLLTSETTVAGFFEGEFEQSAISTGVLICSEITLPQNIVTPKANTWSVAWGDYDNDCYPDLFIANYDTDEANILYKNNGDGTFTETSTGLFGSDLAGSTVGTWGDFDNDDDLDLFVANNIGFKNFLYRNEGGSFTKIQNDPIVNEIGYAHGSSWIDYDNDGFLDMFTSEFFVTRFNNLYRNNGDGTFTKNTTSTITLDAASSVAGIWGDYDNDGDQDLFVANTNDENNLFYRNEGGGNFAKITSSIIASDGGKSVGASWGDYDNDGYLDLFVANAGNQNNFLYHNEGNGNFTKVTNSPVMLDGGDSHGSAWADINNDGWLDLMVTNDQNSINFLYMNDGTGNFTKVDHRLSLFTTGGGNSFGTAFADFDNDGDLDLFVANHNDQNNYLISNDTRTKQNTNFINIKLKGTNSNTTAIGSRVAVKATIDGQSLWMIREVSALTGGGIGGQSDTRLHFGLGDATIIDSLVVTWTSGYKQVETNVAINQSCYLITEVAGATVSGTVYFDENKNGVQDVEEIGIPGVNIEVEEQGKVVTTDDNGYYEVILNIGTYTLKQDLPNSSNWSQYLPSSQGTHSVTVASIGTDYPNNDFADTASCLLPDLSVELSTTALRVGFESIYAIRVANNGTKPAYNVTLDVDFGEHIIPYEANINWDSNNGTIFSWDLGIMEINEVLTIYVVDSVKTTAVIGDSLTVTALVLASGSECNALDNQFTNTEETVGAIDPNDITAYPGDFVDYNQEIVYRIRFQNVGNATASRVIVHDELPENLDINTLILGQASHPYKFSIEGERTLVWDFENINLPDSIANEPESHGFVWIKIKPVQEIQSGDEIPNFATIFFDNADPIVTNTAIVTVTGSDASGDLSLFPNPVTDNYFDLKLESAFNQQYEELIKRVHIFNTNGNLLHSVEGLDDKQVRVRIQSLPKGEYFVVVTTNKGNRYTKSILVF